MEDDWEEEGEPQVEEEEQEEEDILDTGDGGEEARETEGLLMRFCPHDSSMLYPKEDKRTRSLQYACRLCAYTESAAGHPLIYRNILKKEIGNILHTVPSAIKDDPTLARSFNVRCGNCNHNEAVFFQSVSGRSDSLTLIFVCCNCEHKWVN